MPRIELAQLIGNLTPEQEIFTSWFYSQFDNGSAAHRRIINVEPFYYQGAIAGSEFLTYVNTKLYLCFSMVSEGGVNANILGFLTFYNEANAVFYNQSNDIGFWNTGGVIAVYINNNYDLTNFYFSRLVTANLINLKFIGYRITLN